MIPKPKQDIATHAFHFSNALKGFIEKFILKARPEWGTMVYHLHYNN